MLYALNQRQVLQLKSLVHLRDQSLTAERGRPRHSQGYGRERNDKSSLCRDPRAHDMSQRTAVAQSTAEAQNLCVPSLAATYCARSRTVPTSQDSATYWSFSAWSFQSRGFNLDAPRSSQALPKTSSRTHLYSNILVILRGLLWNSSRSPFLAQTACWEVRPGASMTQTLCRGWHSLQGREVGIVTCKRESILWMVARAA